MPDTEKQEQGHMKSHLVKKFDQQHGILLLSVSKLVVRSEKVAEKLDSDSNAAKNHICKPQRLRR
jgi:hypothetical protein